MDIASAEGDEEVAGAEEVASGGASGGVGGGGEDLDFIAFVGADGVDDGLAGDARDGEFASWVDVEDEECVAVGEGGGELVFEELGTGVAMGLEDADDAAGGEAAGGFEGGGDFGGVVAVVVDDGVVRGAEFDVEAAFRAAERAEGPCDAVEGDAHVCGEGDDGEGVEDVVAAGDVEDEVA